MKRTHQIDFKLTDGQRLTGLATEAGCEKLRAVLDKGLPAAMQMPGNDGETTYVNTAHIVTIRIAP